MGSFISLNKFVRQSPTIVFCLVCLNLVLVKYAFSYMYVVPLIIAIFVFLLSGKLRFSANDGPFLAYFSFVIINSMYHLMINPDSYVYIVPALGDYLLFPFFWFLYLKVYGIEKIAEFFKMNFPWLLIIGALGIIQYYFSPTLFGLYSTTTGELMYRWAMHQPFAEYSRYFRSTSLCTSSQIYGLFITLYFLTYVQLFKYYPTSLVRFLVYVFIIFSVSLSGDKSVFVLFASFLIYLFFSGRLDRRLLPIIFILALVYAGGMILYHNSSAFSRIAGTSFSDVYTHESGGRLRIYLEYILHANPLVGGGAGSASSFGKEYLKLDNVAESYFVQVYSELGLFGLLLFSVFLFTSMVYMGKRYAEKYRVILFISIISMIFVQGFDAVNLFPFWSIFFISTSREFARQANSILPNGRRNGF